MTAADRSSTPGEGRVHICGSGDGVCASCYPQERGDGFPNRKTEWSHFSLHYDGGLGRYVVVEARHTVVAVADNEDQARAVMGHE